MNDMNSFAFAAYNSNFYFMPIALIIEKYISRYFLSLVLVLFDKCLYQLAVEL